MQRDTRYRFVTLLVSLGIVAVVFVFLTLVRIAADAHVDLDQLPSPVLEALREQAGDDPTLVQVFRSPSPNTRTYHIVLELPDGSSKRLWLAADGSSRPPQAAPPPTD